MCNNNEEVTTTAEGTHESGGVYLQDTREKQYFFKKKIMSLITMSQEPHVIKDMMLPNNCKC